MSDKCSLHFNFFCKFLIRIKKEKNNMYGSFYTVIIVIQFKLFFIWGHRKSLIGTYSRY